MSNAKTVTQDNTLDTLQSQGDWSSYPIEEAKVLALEVVNEWDITNRQQQFIKSIERSTDSSKLFQAVWATTMSGLNAKGM